MTDLKPPESRVCNAVRDEILDYNLYLKKKIQRHTFFGDDEASVLGDVKM